MMSWYLNVNRSFSLMAKCRLSLLYLYIHTHCKFLCKSNKRYRMFFTYFTLEQEIDFYDNLNIKSHKKVNHTFSKLNARKIFLQRPHKISVQFTLLDNRQSQPLLRQVWLKPIKHPIWLPKSWILHQIDFQNRDCLQLEVEQKDKTVLPCKQCFSIQKVYTISYVKYNTKEITYLLYYHNLRYKAK